MIELKSYDSLMPSRWRVAVYLNEQMQKALEQWAAEENRSVSNLAATILMNAIKEHQVETKPPSLVKTTSNEETSEQKNIASLVKENFYQLLEDGKIRPEILKAIAAGEKPSHADLLQIAHTLNMREEDLLEMRDRSFPNQPERK
jgi:hypothetical protein